MNIFSAFLFLIIPHQLEALGDFSTCSDTLPPSLGCGALPGGMAHVVLTVLSTSFYRKEELKAFSWIKKKIEFDELGLLRGGNEAAPAAPAGTEGWEHKNLFKP